MAIVGFSFSKFDCKRGTPSGSGSIDINHNIGFTDIEKSSLNVGGSKNEVLKIKFHFNIKYGNSLGDIGIEGEVIYSDTPEIISEVFKTWESEKKLNSSINEQVFKFVYGKASIKALEFADSLNLPSPIPLPKINFSNTKN